MAAVEQVQHSGCLIIGMFWKEVEGKMIGSGIPQTNKHACFFAEHVVSSMNRWIRLDLAMRCHGVLELPVLD